MFVMSLVILAFLLISGAGLILYIWIDSEILYKIGVTAGVIALILVPFRFLFR